MRRSGGWVLGLAVVLAMAGGGGFVLRRVLKRIPLTIALLRAGNGRGPTDDAIERGARIALQEWGGRAGRYRIQLSTNGPEDSSVWIGTSEALLLQGDRQPVPFLISALDTHPAEPTGCYRILPGCARQGRGAAAWAKKSGSARVFLLRDTPSLRSEAIAAAFMSSARKLGLAVEGPLEYGGEYVDRVLASRADLVFYSGEEAPYATAYKLFTTLRERGFTGTLLMGEADPEVSFLTTRPDLVEGSYLVSPFAPAPAELAARMDDVPGPHVTAGYFAMKAALETIDLANSIHPEDLRRAAGKLPYFDTQGEAALRLCALYVARNGKFEFIETLK
jgi:hypothetical protein